MENKKLVERVKKLTTFCALIFSFYAVQVQAQMSDEEVDITLCALEEDIYFSCPLPGNKIVSICASGNINPDSGYVQYRYGSPEHVEMLFPLKKSPPKNKFFTVNASEGSVNKGIIKFKNGSYTYIVAQAFVSFLTVLKGDEVVLRKPCDEGGKAFLNPAVLQGIEEKQKSAEDFR